MRHHIPTLHKRQLAFALASLAVVAAVAFMPQLLGDRVRDGIGGVGEASRGWLWVAGFAFVASLAASACAWRLAIRRCGGDITHLDAAARFGSGSLANALLPAKLGTALRIGLFSRALHGKGRVWTAGGIGTALGVAHWVWLGAMLSFGAATGVLPAWPIGVVVLLGCAAALTARLARNSEPGGRTAHVFDAFAALGRCPRAAAQLLGWVGLATVARIAAATALAWAFGIDRPLLAAMLVVPAVELAGTLPLTPGNLGVASAAVAFALTAHGAATDVAVSAGIAFGAIETSAGIAFGAGGVLYLAGAAAPADGYVRRRITAAAAVTGCLALGAAFGATVLLPLV